MKFNTTQLRSWIEENMGNTGMVFTIISKLRDRNRPDELRIYNARFKQFNRLRGGTRLYSDDEKNLLTIVDTNATDIEGKKAAYRTVNCNDIAFVACKKMVLVNDLVSYKHCKNYAEAMVIANKYRRS